MSVMVVRPSVSVSARLVAGWRSVRWAKDMLDRRDASLFFVVDDEVFVVGVFFVAAGCFVFFTTAAGGESRLAAPPLVGSLCLFLLATTSLAPSNNQSILLAFGSFSFNFCLWLNNNSRTFVGVISNRCARLANSSSRVLDGAAFRDVVVVRRC